MYYHVELKKINKKIQAHKGPQFMYINLLDL